MLSELPKICERRGDNVSSKEFCNLSALLSLKGLLEFEGHGQCFVGEVFVMLTQECETGTPRIGLVVSQPSTIGYRWS